MSAPITRRVRENLATTQRVLTGGEISQVQQEEWRKAHGLPEPSPPREPMRRTSDMATRDEVRRRIDEDLDAEKRAARRFR